MVAVVQPLEDKFLLMKRGTEELHGNQVLFLQKMESLSGTVDMISRKVFGLEEGVSTALQGWETGTQSLVADMKFDMMEIQGAMRSQEGRTLTGMAGLRAELTALQQISFSTPVKGVLSTPTVGGPTTSVSCHVPLPQMASPVPVPSVDRGEFQQSQVKLHIMENQIAGLRSTQQRHEVELMNMRETILQMSAGRVAMASGNDGNAFINTLHGKEKERGMDKRLSRGLISNGVETGAPMKTQVGELEHRCSSGPQVGTSKWLGGQMVYDLAADNGTTMFEGGSMGIIRPKGKTSVSSLGVENPEMEWGFRKDSVELALDGQGFMRTSVEQRMLTEGLLCHAPDPQYPQAPMCGVQAIGELRDVAPIAATTGTASMVTLFNSITSAHPTLTRKKQGGWEDFERRWSDRIELVRNVSNNGAPVHDAILFESLKLCLDEADKTMMQRMKEQDRGITFANVFAHLRRLYASDPSIQNRRAWEALKLEHPQNHVTLAHWNVFKENYLLLRNRVEDRNEGEE